MKVSSALADLNDLTSRNGLWVLNQPALFNYSDGEDSELFLKRVVSEARDLTSQSSELEAAYLERDWVAEYHLSYKRANLIRGLNLSGIQNALEIGSGCGAITRYLGEQGICLDAVEGSPRRADIARLRCRDLDNVHIINANYNDLLLPEAAYDAVFVIGVIEYAKRFMPEAENDEMAVVAILKQLQKALTQDGVMIIAIENKNGLKYWLGATEDHYGHPYVGLTNYWGLSGTKTYSYPEWPELLQQADIAHWHFQFPFPDYKLPQVTLDEEFIEHDENAHSLLYRVASRDYLRPWQSGANEFTIWRSLHQSGQLKEFANSFLIFAGQEAEAIRSLIPYDFAYFSGGSRKPEFRTVTSKERHVDRVSKKNLWTNGGNFPKDVAHHAVTGPYIKGALLSTIWIETLLALDRAQFEHLLNQYYRFIKQQLHTGAESELIDALPANIVVDTDGQYNIIDREWQLPESVTAEFVLFRALLWFGHDNLDLLASFHHSHGLNTLSEWVEFGFQTLSIFQPDTIEDFTIKEDAIQFRVSGQRNLRPIKVLLATPSKHLKHNNSCIHFFWTGKNNNFDNSRSYDVNYRFENGRGVARCRFAYNERISRVRIMPRIQASEAKIFILTSLVLRQFRENGDDGKVIWRAEISENIASDVDYNHFIFPLTSLKGGFIANDNRACLDFHLIGKQDAVDSANGLFELELVVANETALGPSFIAEQMTHRTDDVEREITARVKREITAEWKRRIREMDRVIEEKDILIAAKDDTISQLKVQLHDANIQTEENQVGQSAAMSEIRQIRKFLDRLSQVKLIKNAGRVMPGKYGWITSGLGEYGYFRVKESDYDLLNESGLFDETFYQKQQSGSGQFDGDLLRHYLEVGWLKGMHPNRLFDPSFYRQQYPELVTNKINPLVHYITVGIKEGKNPCYLFDTQYYLDQCSDLAPTPENPLKHYLEKGGKIGIDPHPAFDTNYYFTQYPDAKESDLTPLEHFLEFGEPNKISPSPLFDWAYYMENRPDLRNSTISGFRHYLEQGYKEGDRDPLLLLKRSDYFKKGLKSLKYKAEPISHYVTKGQFDHRKPNLYFDPDYYEKQQDPKVKQDYKDPFSHYITIGEATGLNPHPLLDTVFYKTQLAKINCHPESLLYHFYLNRFDHHCMTHPLLEPGFCRYQTHHEDLNGESPADRFYNEGDMGDAKNPHPLFDVDYYRTHLNSEDLGRINPLIHYIKKGCRQLLATYPEFNPQYYYTQDLDPRLGKDQCPVEHYIYHGAQKGQWPSPEIAQLEYKPSIALVLLINGSDLSYLPGRTIAMISQLYPRWRATVMVRNPDSSYDYRYAKALAEDDRRIQWIETDDVAPASQLFNQILKERKEKWLVFINERMILEAHALLTFVRRLNEDQNIALIHTDKGENDPECTPIEHPREGRADLSNRFFIGPLACFRRSLIDQMGGFATCHQSPYDASFLTHYLHQVPINSVSHISEPLHFTMANDPLHIEVRNP